MILEILIYIMFGILIMSMILFLAETIYHDYQKTKFNEELKQGISVRYKDDLFVVYESEPDSDEVTIYNLFYNPFVVDKEDTHPLKPYKTIVSNILKN